MSSRIPPRTRSVPLGHLGSVSYGLKPLLYSLGLFLLTAFVSAAWADPARRVTHGISMLGAPALSENFERLPYSDRTAQPGGRLRDAKIGSFDNLNPFTIRGTPAYDIRELVFESLLGRSMDEPFSLYGLLAEQVAVSEQRDRMQIRLRANAQFSDGTQITADDVKFSWQVLRDRGRPNHRAFYSHVDRIDIAGPRDLTFHFKGPPYDRELPLIVGLMPILPKHHYEQFDIQSSSLEVPLGSGPYLVDQVDAGRQIVFKRNPSYWGWSNPLNRNRYNFDIIQHDYFRDENSAFEAFKAGEIDFWRETNPTRWLTGYDFPALMDGRVIKEALPIGSPTGLNAFVFNTRQEQFSDIRVRAALDHLFDFNWINEKLFGGVYRRTQSYFGGTQLSGQASTAQDVYTAPESDGSGRDRAQRRIALDLMKVAGYRLQDSKMVNTKTGAALTFEILVQRRDHERLALAYQHMLAQLGIECSVRLVDAAQYQRRIQNYDFDMIVYDYYASLSPGNEQNYYWSSQAANTPGSRNYAGIRSPDIDAAISALTNATTSQSFIEAAQTLDRHLMAGHYVIPLFHADTAWVAYWHTLEHPRTTPLYGPQLDSWWASPLN